MEKISLIDKAAAVLSGFLDFKRLSEKIVSIMMEENSDYTGTALFILEDNGSVLRAYTYKAAKEHPKFEKIAGKAFNKLTTPILPKTENLMGEIVRQNRIIESNTLIDFVYPTISKAAGLVVEKISQGKKFIGVPILGYQGIVGVLFVASRKEYFSNQEKELLQSFSRQIGIAMSNAIAHEKIMKKMQMTTKRKTKFDQPSIKFTLRITPRIEKYLSWKIKNTEKTKADYLRGEIEKIMEEDDEFQNIFSDGDKNEG